MWACNGAYQIFWCAPKNWRTEGHKKSLKGLPQRVNKTDPQDQSEELDKDFNIAGVLNKENEENSSDEEVEICCKAPSDFNYTEFEKNDGGTKKFVGAWYVCDW